MSTGKFKLIIDIPSKIGAVAKLRDGLDLEQPRSYVNVLRPAAKSTATRNFLSEKGRGDLTTAGPSCI